MTRKEKRDRTSNVLKRLGQIGAAKFYYTNIKRLEEEIKHCQQQKDAYKEFLKYKYLIHDQKQKDILNNWIHFNVRLQNAKYKLERYRNFLGKSIGL
jgi:hypothetical protein